MRRTGFSRAKVAALRDLAVKALNGTVPTSRVIKLLDEESTSVAELEEFMDAPVRTYSSGMYLRLAFSVAVHVDPDVLLVDEVLAVGDLRLFFPRVLEANLVKAHVVKEQRATFSAAPETESLRPSAHSPLPGVFFAGDWTRTGWPATMEGAVRSGYLAAESVAHVGGQQESAFLVADLPASGLMRIFG